MTNPGFGSRAPLINISSRARVGTGDDVLIAGFVVDGPEPKRVLVRGVGPTLSTQGVTSSLTDPQITLYGTGQQRIAVNDNWSDGTESPEVARASAQVGAFSLPSGSRDAALILTLEPGAYSVVVTGENSTTGVALAEVYEVLP